MIRVSYTLPQAQVSTTAHRGSRLRNGIQLRQRPASQNTVGTSSNGRRPKLLMQASTFTPPSSKPRGRQSRNSRAAQAGDDSIPRSPPQRGRPSRQAKSKSRGLSLGSWEDEDGDEEEDVDDGDDGEDWEPGLERRKNGGGRAKGWGNSKRGRKRAVTYSTEDKEGNMEDGHGEENDGSSDDSDDDGNDDQDKGKRKVEPVPTSWECPRCTVGNEFSNNNCYLCGERRPVSAQTKGSRKKSRFDGGGVGSVSSNGSSSGSGGDGAVSDGDRAVSSGARGVGASRGRGRVTSIDTTVVTAPRQRRQVARVNYAEDDDEEDEEGEEEDRESSSSARVGSSHHRTGRRADQRSTRPRIREELRRGGGKEEHVLTDDVQKFRRRVRSAIAIFCRESCAEPFLNPVDLVAYPNYVDFVAEPMDLATILYNLRHGMYDDVVEVRCMFDMLVASAHHEHALEQ